MNAPLKVHDRPCGECRHFILGAEANILGVCRPKLMAVTSSMRVTYYPEPQEHWQNGLCFEAKEP